MAEYSSFPAIVCERLRNLVKARKRLEGDRDRAFDNKADAEEAVREAGNNERKVKEALSEVGRLDMLLRTLKRRIKGIGNEITDLIDSPDREQDELPFTSPQVRVSDYDKVEEDDEDEDDKDQQKIPWTNRGRKAEYVEPNPGDFDQHMNAPVADLEFTPALTKALVEGHLKTVQEIHVFLEGTPEGGPGDLTTIAGIGPEKAAEVAKTVKRFCRKHRQAMVQHDKETVTV